MARKKVKGPIEKAGKQKQKELETQKQSEKANKKPSK
jgi:hypothetical protein